MVYYNDPEMKEILFEKKFHDGFLPIFGIRITYLSSICEVHIMSLSDFATFIHVSLRSSSFFTPTKFFADNTSNGRCRNIMVEIYPKKCNQRD